MQMLRLVAIETAMQHIENAKRDQKEAEQTGQKKFERIRDPKIFSSAACK